MGRASRLKLLSGKVDPDKQNRMTRLAPIFRSDFTPSTPRNAFIPYLHTFIRVLYKCEEIRRREATGCRHGGEHRRRLFELQYDLRRLHVTARI